MSSPDEDLTTAPASSSEYWTDLKSGRPAGESIIAFLADEEWNRPRNRSNAGPRKACQACLIRDNTTGETLFSWNEKSEGQGTLIEGVSQWLGSYLVHDPEPTVRRLWVHRSPNPDMRDWDSSHVFLVANDPYFHDEDDDDDQEQPPDTREGVGGIPGIMRGPSPIGVRTYNAPPVQLTGDIGGAGIAQVAGQIPDQAQQFVGLIMNVLGFSADIVTRTLAWQAEEQRKAPTANMRRAELRHDFRMKRLEVEKETKGQTVRDVGGVVSDIADKVTGLPVVDRIAENIAKKIGLLDPDPPPAS